MEDSECFNLAIEILLFSGNHCKRSTPTKCCLFQSRNRDTSLFRIDMSTLRTQFQAKCFNLAIEILLFSGENTYRADEDMYFGFNLAIEILLFSGCVYTPHRHNPPQRFNLAIEILLFSGAIRCNIIIPVSRRIPFQSRNRDTSLFRQILGIDCGYRQDFSFNLAIEILLFSGVEVVIGQVF